MDERDEAIRRAGRARSVPALLVVGAVLLGLGALGPAPAIAAPIAEADRSAAGVRSYWTPERMQAAQPPPSTSVDPQGTGAGAGPAPGSAGFLRDEIGDPSEEPFRAHGKVFFTVSGGSDPGNYLCSGTAIASSNRSVVWTAGHCVFDHEFGGGFATNWLFVPAYRDGAAPFGKWAARKLAAPERWRQDGSLKHDLGAAVVGENGDGETLTDVVGSRQIGFNQPRDQTYEVFGYPAELPFTGDRPYRCTAQLGGTDDPGGVGPSTSWIGCDMTRGVSGGGWVVGDSVLSVNSYSYCLELICEQRLYGPYQGEVAQDLYGTVAGRSSFCMGRRVTHLGSDDDDVLVGTGGRDVFKTRGGDDLIRARGGGDYVCSGSGRDLARGGSGRDTLSGQGDGDALRGGRGRRDECNGGPGRDRANGCERERLIP